MPKRLRSQACRRSQVTFIADYTRSALTFLKVRVSLSLALFCVATPEAAVQAGEFKKVERELKVSCRGSRLNLLDTWTV